MVVRELVTVVTDQDLLEANRYLYDAYIVGHNEPDPEYTWDDLEPDDEDYEYDPLEHLWMIYPF